MIEIRLADDKKMPGPHQWEATFSRTSHQVTTQAVKTITLQKGGL